MKSVSDIVVYPCRIAVSSIQLLGVIAVLNVLHLVDHISYAGIFIGRLMSSRLGLVERRRSCGAMPCQKDNATKPSALLDRRLVLVISRRVDRFYREGSVSNFFIWQCARTTSGARCSAS